MVETPTLNNAPSDNTPLPPAPPRQPPSRLPLDIRIWLGSVIGTLSLSGLHPQILSAVWFGGRSGGSHVLRVQPSPKWANGNTRTDRHILTGIGLLLQL
jgi:hypothetical protein